MDRRPLLIFDGDCGFCARCARFVARRMPTGADIRPWQRVNLGAHGLSADRARYELLWVGPSGRVDGGAQAIARLLLDCGGLWALPGALLRVPPLRWIGHLAYRSVANNRHRLSRGRSCSAGSPPSERD